MANWLEDRAEQKRRTADAAADRRRQDAIAAAKVEAIKQQTAAEIRHTEAEHADKRRREQRKDQQRERDTQQARRAAKLKTLRKWAAAHMVDLMIYPLAIVSAVMAIPAMAHFGQKVYNSGTGAVLPVITELGMWAFAFAVEYSRHKHPERPVWALQIGVLTFTGVGGTLNYLDGATVEGGSVGNGVVMAVVSIAGVVAHQLVKASPRRSRAERDALRVARHAAAKIAAVRKAVIDASIARVDGNGEVVLMFSPGDYKLAAKRKLDPIEADQPTTDTTVSEVDRKLAEVVDEWTRGDSTEGPIEGAIPVPVGGPIDRPTGAPILAPIVTPPIDPNSDGDQPGSTPTHTAGRPPRSTPDGARDRRRRARRDRGAGKPTQTRSIEDLRADLKAAIADPTIDVNPDSAESIRKTLKCSPERARELRDNPNG